MAEMTLRVRDSETEDETTGAGKRRYSRERTKLRAFSYNLMIFGDDPCVTMVTMTTIPPHTPSAGGHLLTAVAVAILSRRSCFSVRGQNY